MTVPSPETIEREQHKLFLTDAELIRRLGVPEKKAREAIRMAEAKAGFPKKQKLWGDRRYWPAVKAWLDKHHGLPDPSKLAR
ncbi:winged helix-turn-helix domain-containing protein [Bradyrhizobium sp. 137]|uniref:winged helix-turn-helix domain-containing protein n=1 Tax=Bradyrhizobium sp. 137 TaxID=2782614 RepID=UPI001FF8A6D8|nr:winged helix-turn-helix domain-containing protein [Bradyrhizobium sp. 137]MCK1753822.1 winged helix-turn-helix domain-containing protein [Bradyrhizobium sp. 137]